MVDRYAIFEDAKTIAAHFGLETAVDFQYRYNAFPSLELPVITSRSARSLSFHFWGLSPEMAANKQVSPKLINLSTDVILNRPVQLNGLKKKRCIIPVNGFYVWRPIGKKKVVPTYIYRKDGAMMGVAGLWEEYEDIRGKKHSVFTMVTMPAADGMQIYQPSLPAYIQPEQYKNWLANEQSTEKLLAMLEKLNSSEMKAHTVTPKISENSINEANMLLEVHPADQFGNYTLFDLYS